MVTDQLEPAVQAPVDSKIESSAKPIFEVLKDNENTPQETTEDSPDNVADSDEKDIVALAVESGHADSVTNGATTDVEVVAVFDSSSIAAGPVPPIQVSGYDPRYRRNFEIEVLYYDPKDFLITNKPWDLRVDGDTSTSPTAESLLYAHFTEHSKLYLLHQLDYVTSGIHCWGLSKQAASNVGKSFMRKEIKKTYTALVRGHVQEDSFIIDKDLVDDPQDEKRSVIAQNGTGKPSQTEVQVLARGYFLESPVSHVALTPVTGRRHQLRVHLAAIGHPIIGDPAYEHPKSEDAFRTMLHSWKLEMPVTKVKTLKFEAAEPFGSLI
ncbi:pseudouridine synthase, partial [Phlyctochytrium arcticum]